MVIDPGSMNKGGVHGTGTSSTRVKPEQTAARADSSTSEPSRTGAAPQDSVSLSQQAHAMSKLEAQAMQSKDVDEAKVAAIRQALAEGRYVVDSQSLANKMLEQDNLF